MVHSRTVLTDHYNVQLAAPYPEELVSDLAVLTS
jgi:hypothetical protein